MCGNDVDSLSAVRVEGSVLQLCTNCAKFGKPITPPAGPPVGPHGQYSEFAEARRPTALRPRRLEERDVFSEMPEMELRPDWFHRIRHQRELLGWTPEELGKRLNEKKSLVLKVETGSFRPPDATLRKIERLLKVRLTADPEAASP